MDIALFSNIILYVVSAMRGTELLILCTRTRVEADIPTARAYKIKQQTCVLREIGKPIILNIRCLLIYPDIRPSNKFSTEFQY